MQMNRRNVHKNAYSGGIKGSIGRSGLRGANLSNRLSKRGRGDFSLPARSPALAGRRQVALQIGRTSAWAQSNAKAFLQIAPSFSDGYKLCQILSYWLNCTYL